jgi:uncharacterized membrane protein YtjA (UPF0391 family)
VPYDSYSIHVDSEIKLLRNIKKFNRIPHLFLFKTGIAAQEAMGVAKILMTISLPLFIIFVGYLIIKKKI